MASKNKIKVRPRTASTDGTPPLCERSLTPAECGIIEHIRSEGMSEEEAFARLTGPASGSVLSPRKVAGAGLDLVFQFTHGKEPARSLLNVHVVICDAARWLEDPRSLRYSGISTVLLTDGLIAAAWLEPGHREDDGWDETDPQFAAALKRLRDRLIGWLESQEWVRSASLNFGPNGQFDVDFTTDDPPIGGGRPWLVLKAMPHESVR